jgi:hypothetical protein
MAANIQRILLNWDAALVDIIKEALSERVILCFVFILISDAQTAVNQNAVKNVTLR